MNSIFIAIIGIFLGVLVNQSKGNHHNNDIDLVRVTQLYDTVIDLITKKDGDDCCQTKLNNLGDLLCDSFTHCYAGFDECMDKDEFLAGAKTHCDEYKEVEDFIEITRNSNSYDYSVSLSVKLVHTQMDDCKMTKTYDEVITYNDGGLITKIEVPSPAKETLNCPSYKEPTTTTNAYGEETQYGQASQYIEEPTDGAYGEEQDLPPVAVDDYVTTEMNTPVIIDVLDNDYDPDEPGVSGKQALEIGDPSQGSKGKVEQKGNKLRYKPYKDVCGSDSFTYFVVDLDDGLTDSATVYVDIACPPDTTNAYPEEPAGGSSYGEEPTPDYNNGYNYVPETRKLKNLKVDVAVEYQLHGGFTAVTDTYELEQIEADLVRLHSKIGKDVADISLVEAFVKDISEYRIRYRCGLQYTGHAPEPVVLDDGTVHQVGGALAFGYIEYDVVDAKDEKKQKVREWAEGFGRALCISKEDKVDDFENTNKFCVNLEYEAICHSDSCYMFKNKFGDRDSYSHFLKQYENMFDEATLEIENDVMMINYRKGSCSGQYVQKVEIEYDEDNLCISKWIDYMDDVTLTDPDCGNSVAKLFEKLETECKHDGEDEAHGDYGYEPETELETTAGSAYGGNDEKEKIRELGDKLADIACKGKKDTFDDHDFKNKICVDMEYEAVCDNEEKCGAYAGKSKGMSAFVNVMRQYQDMFDDATVTIENDAFLCEYRKGSCSGYYVIRTEIEYDQYNQCVSKWTDYYDDLVLSDQHCENNNDKWMNKILNQCKYDDENDNNQYGTKEPGFPILVTKEKDDKEKILKSFYHAAFDCRLKQNKGNTQLLDTFMGYLSDSCKLCVENVDGETCYDKDEIRSMMGDRYTDDNESIDYNVDITYNDGTTIESKCTSRRKKSNGCIVIKEEYDTCLFNGDGSIKEFKVNRSNKREECGERVY